MSEVRRLRVGTQGRIVLPRGLREELGAEEGAVYAARVEDGALILEPPERVLRRLQDRASAASPSDVSWVDELIAERRHEVRREAEAP
jgi:bifunctional DNA-binding transcriptional regulator/antitoxin component of YhaV-PrlF toxin-antitoxin module